MSEYYTLIVIMSHITGLSEEEIKTKRQYPVPYYRAMIAEQLKVKKYSLTRIAKLLNRNHATIIHILDKLKDFKEFPFDKQLQKTYKRFLELVENANSNASINNGCIWKVGKGERHCNYCTVQFCEERINKETVGRGVLEHLFYTTSDLKVFTNRKDADSWEKKLTEI